MPPRNDNRIFDGFVTVAAVTPEVRPGDCRFNISGIFKAVYDAIGRGAQIVVTPELSVTGYTCGDLFLQDRLLEDARAALSAFVRSTRGRDELIFVGLPFLHEGKLYNVAAAVCGGALLGLVPKTWLPTYGEFYEARHFTPAPRGTDEVRFNGWTVPFGPEILFRNNNLPALTVACEICEDLWVPDPPSTRHAMAGATIVVNLSAGDETIGKEEYRRLLVQSQSGRDVCAYVYANAGFGESTQDMVFSGHALIAENGALLAEKPPFKDGLAIADVDVQGLARDRRYLTTWQSIDNACYSIVPFAQRPACGLKHRAVDPHPFVPGGFAEREARCERILQMQASGLAKRLAHTKSKVAVIGVSGGLDSTLALLVTKRAMDQLGRPAKEILAVSMPGFGTTQGTQSNARTLARAMGVLFGEIDITPSVRQHLKDIGHSEAARDATYENAQARMRTMLLMDLANKFGGIVVGTGDLSELALGWATYNGDHMSMYGVNAGVPKTLVRYLIGHVADADLALRDVLHAVLDTPVSPELLPPENGQIAQKTEDILGPYELHDFFLYHMVRKGRTPSCILSLAEKAFAGRYDEIVILTALRLFYRRFFANQFKRSALPDGPKIGSVTLSPR
ncbi:MAG: NAD(+) synthase, partial [Clostridiales Family XIII bacterium]|nr:NAD(+) synthase [Clostridiales Family XIII bacterium]